MRKHFKEKIQDELLSMQNECGFISANIIINSAYQDRGRWQDRSAKKLVTKLHRLRQTLLLRFWMTKRKSFQRIFIKNGFNFWKREYDLLGFTHNRSHASFDWRESASIEFSRVAQLFKCPWYLSYASIESSDCLSSASIFYRLPKLFNIKISSPHRVHDQWTG